MLTPISWLKEYVPVDVSIKDFVDDLTMSGTKVEGYEEKGKDIEKVVVGKIVEIERHPDADKLVVCQVDIGEASPIQIVTGAPNIKLNDVIPVALDGAKLPGGIKIKKSKLRGIESNGMMCSVDELGTTREAFPDAPEDGVYVFQEIPVLGSNVVDVMGLAETIVEYEVTSNRVDCFSIVGIAREVAATYNLPFHYPDIKTTGNQEKAEDYASIEIQASDLCDRYLGRVVKNVVVEPSPKWMQQRLLACGVRPINNIVDITNYVMLELGQPMHAFDIDKLAGKKIIVRKATLNEKILTLDEQERTLDDSILVISDTDRAVAIAGIMGGEETKVTDETNTILLESANFDGTNIRLSSKKVGLRSDSSSKFEKGLDPNLVEAGMNRACQLIEMLGAGEVVGGGIDVYPTPRMPREIPFEGDKINTILGTDLTHEEMLGYLGRVACDYNQEAKMLNIPTFRPDLERTADIAEEVARLYGYNNIPTTLPTGVTTVGKKNFKQTIEDIVKNSVEQYGFNEALTFSFESPKVFDKLSMKPSNTLREAITIMNPLGEDYSVMRTTTLHGMLSSLATNYNRRNKDVRLYELANVYLPESLPLTTLPDERMQLTLGMYGQGDFFELKGVLESLFSKIGLLKPIKYDPTIELEWLHPGRKANIIYNKQVLGYLGQIHPDVAENYDINTPVYIGVLDMPTVTKLATLDRIYTPLAKYPAVSRDISLIMREEILVGQIEEIIRKNGGKIFEACKLFDLYQGEQIQKGYKSAAFSISFRAQDRTLEEKDVVQVMNKILTELDALGIALRSN